MTFSLNPRQGSEFWVPSRSTSDRATDRERIEEGGWDVRRPPEAIGGRRFLGGPPPLEGAREAPVAIRDLPNPKTGDGVVKIASP